MVAAPQMATMTFIGRQTGQTYSKDVYLSDVVAGLVNWDSGAGASANSETFWTPPEAVVMRDFSILTGMTDTTAMQITKNGVPSGNILRYANYLNTLNSRPPMMIAFPAGTKIGLIQIA